MTTDDLARIYIRAQCPDLDISWRSYSLQELLDLGQGERIWDWFKRKMGDRVIPISLYESGAVMDERRVLNLLRILEASGTTVYRVRVEPESS